MNNWIELLAEFKQKKQPIGFVTITKILGSAPCKVGSKMIVTKHKEIFGMTLAYYGKITAKNGAIEQNNYHDYEMIRMNEIPKVHVEIVESTENPTGVGEPGVPVIAPAIINAIYKITGKRYYNLPLSDYDLV